MATITCPNCKTAQEVPDQATSYTCTSCATHYTFRKCAKCSSVIHVKGTGAWICPNCQHRNRSARITNKQVLAGIVTVSLVAGVIYAIAGGGSGGGGTTTPASCVRALDLADQGFTIIGDGFFAAARGDTATMQASTRQLNDVSARAGPETTDCRSSNPPTACISALDEASQGFLIASDGFNAAARLDIAGVQDAADRMDALSPSYQSDRDSCRGQAS